MSQPPRGARPAWLRPPQPSPAGVNAEGLGGAALGMLSLGLAACTFEVPVIRPIVVTARACATIALSLSGWRVTPAAMGSRAMADRGWFAT